MFAQIGSTWYALSMDQIELNYVFILKGIVWVELFLTLKLRTYAKLNYFK